MLRSLLVHVDASARCHARLLAARDLARRHEARLSALFADAPLELESPYGYSAGSAGTQWLQEMELGRRIDAKRRLAALLDDGDEASWLELQGEALALGVARHALYADLVILGQHESQGADGPGLPADFVESVIIASGRPALVLPRSAMLAPRVDTVVVAWKPSSASAHALAGAMPLLRAAREVHVVAWAEGLDNTHDAESVLAHLQTHGVVAHWQRHTKAPRDICRALLAHCAQVKADLLVMGCYGFGRMRERLLGGVTREMLRSMTLPVLMAH